MVRSRSFVRTTNFSSLFTSTSFHALFWSILFIFICPVIGTVLICYTAGRLLLYLITVVNLFNLRPWQQTIGMDTKSQNELAVVVTGCDCGFGQMFALSLAKKGFVVFAGCISDESMRQYDEFPNIKPLKINVTKDEDPTNAATIVSKWLNDPTASKPRYLHAVLNNAGIGSNGPIDWTSVSNFQEVMEVNYFGAIRIVKAFLPILKSQSSNGSYKFSRIMIVVSFVGQVALPGSPAYVASKHALESFTTCLRMEMKAFDIPVVSINPTIHGTTMLNKATNNFEEKWRFLSPALKAEYGQDCYRVWFKCVAEDTLTIAWEAIQAVSRITHCVEVKQPPPHIILGIDGRFALIFLKILPVWLVSPIMAATSPMIQPLRMRNPTMHAGNGF